MAVPERELLLHPRASDGGRHHRDPALLPRHAVLVSSARAERPSGAAGAPRPSGQAAQLAESRKPKAAGLLAVFGPREQLAQVREGRHGECEGPLLGPGATFFFEARHRRCPVQKGSICMFSCKPYVMDTSVVLNLCDHRKHHSLRETPSGSV